MNKIDITQIESIVDTHNVFELEQLRERILSILEIDSEDEGAKEVLDMLNIRLGYN